MPAWRLVHGLVNWPRSWSWRLAPCSSGGVSSQVMGTAMMAVKAATAWFLTDWQMRNASGFSSPATNQNSQPCHPRRSFVRWLIGASTSVQSAASIGRSTPMARLTIAVGPFDRRNPAQCHDSRQGGRIRCGAGTSHTCPPACVVSGSASIW